jgi:transcriptional regulator with XRE-family HTH domain
MKKFAPVTGPHPELARLVRQITGDVASRVAARRGNISHDTISRLWNGDRVTESILFRLALGYGVNPNPLLKAAGYPPLPIANAKGVRESVAAAYSPALAPPEGFEALTPADQEVVRATLEALVGALAQRPAD